MKITSMIETRLAEAHRSGKDDHVALLKSLRDDVQPVEADLYRVVELLGLHALNSPKAEHPEPTAQPPTPFEGWSLLVLFVLGIAFLALLVAAGFAFLFQELTR